MSKSHKYNVEWAKPDQKLYILYVYIYVSEQK